MRETINGRSEGWEGKGRCGRQGGGKKRVREERNKKTKTEDMVMKRIGKRDKNARNVFRCEGEGKDGRQ